MKWWQAQWNRSDFDGWIARLFQNFFGRKCPRCLHRTLKMVNREEHFHWKSHSEFVRVFEEQWKDEGCGYGYREIY